MEVPLPKVLLPLYWRGSLISFRFLSKHISKMKNEGSWLGCVVVTDLKSGPVLLSLFFFFFFFSPYIFLGSLKNWKVFSCLIQKHLKRMLFCFYISFFKISNIFRKVFGVFTFIFLQDWSKGLEFSCIVFFLKKISKIFSHIINLRFLKYVIYVDIRIRLQTNTQVICIFFFIV